MIRTGYIRWEIVVEDRAIKNDAWSREIALSAKPSFRNARIKYNKFSEIQNKFVNGQATYNEVLRLANNGIQYQNIIIPNIDDYIWKYSIADKSMIRYWMEKLSHQIHTFANKVVNITCRFPQLIVQNEVIKSNYIKLIELETYKVINGKSIPAPTNELESFEIDVTTQTKGIPELVAAELVKDVFEEKHFLEFAHKNYVTISNGKTYRIPRKTHGFIEVWNDRGEPECSLCVIFKDPGLPPSDEVVMKYLLVKHDVNTLWKVANRFEIKPKTQLCA